MTQSNDMPKEIYVFPDPKSIGDRGFTLTEPEKTCEGLNYTKCIRSDLTPPQSPNRAVLDVLRSILSALPSRREWLDPVLEEQAYDAIAAATQVDEVKDIPECENALNILNAKRVPDDIQALIHKHGYPKNPYVSSLEKISCALAHGWSLDQLREEVEQLFREHLKRQKGR